MTDSILGEKMTGNDPPIVKSLIGSAHGVVIDLGPGSGEQLSRFNNSQITHIYGVEPVIALHPALLEKVRIAGLQDKYTIIGCQLHEAKPALAKLGITEETVDVVVSVKVLCSVSYLPSSVEILYSLLKKGGELAVYEHVKNNKSIVGRTVQEIYNSLWPTFIGGCELTRETGKIIAGVANWNCIEAGDLEGEWSGTMFPHLVGRYIK
jgi:SAM-dependent methyltransferase